MTQQTKLQAALENFRKEMGYDECSMNIYLNAYGQRKKNKGQPLATHAGHSTVDDDMEGDYRVSLRVTINEAGEINYRAESPTIYAKPGNLTDKYLKHAAASDKFTFEAMKIFNEAAE